MYFRPSSNHEHHNHTVQNYIHHFLQLGQDYFSHLGSSQDGHFPNRWRRATQYHEAGIEFRRRPYCEFNPHSLLDIKLRDGILEIPFLFVDDKTSVLFRNFIALEQTSPRVGNDVTSYIVLLAKLMSMPDDVALLARKGVIAHHMRTDKEVSQLSTRLTKGVVFDFYGNYDLKHLCLALEVYYQNRLHRWVAWLRHNHLSNPWLVVAALAGVVASLMLIQDKHPWQIDRGRPHCYSTGFSPKCTSMTSSKMSHLGVIHHSSIGSITEVVGLIHCHCILDESR